MFDKILNKFSKQDLSLSCYVDTATAVGAHAQREAWKGWRTVQYVHRDSKMYFVERRQHQGAVE